MKRMKLFGGSCVRVQLADQNTILLRALPSQKTLSGTIVLNRLWSSNFIGQVKNRKVATIGDFGRLLDYSLISLAFVRHYVFI